MKKLIYVITCFLFLLTLCSCSGSYEDGIAGAPDSGGSLDSLDPDSGEGDNKETTIPAGQLTCAAYFDQEHYSFWNTLISNNQNEKGLFSEYYSKFQTNTQNMIKLSTNAKYAKVILYENDTPTFYTTSDASGVAYVFAESTSSSKKAQFIFTQEDGSTFDTTVNISSENQNIELNVTPKISNLIEIMFIVDTTGSMGDEIRYLQSEISDVINTVKNDNQGVEILVSLLFYRDKQDSYVTKYFDFTSDINSQQKNLSTINASGGGDFEEAVEVAFQLANSKQWNDSQSTKIIVHIADAPSHNEDVADWMSSVKELAKKGVRIITVASSGIDKKTEFLFRTQCLLSNGTYVYLTDDSGIGESHLEPTVEESPTVELLNSCLIRLINGYHTGHFSEAVHYQQEIK